MKNIIYSLFTLLFFNFIIVNSSYSSGPKAPNQKAIKNDLEQAGLEQREKNLEARSNGACGISSGPECSTPSQITPPPPPRPAPKPPPQPSVRKDTRVTPPSASSEKGSPDSPPPREPSSAPNASPQDTVPSAIQDQIPSADIQTPRSLPAPIPDNIAAFSTGAARQAPASEISPSSQDMNSADCINGVCAAPGPADTLSNAVQDATTTLAVDREKAKGCEAKGDSPSVIDILSRTFLPASTYSYADSSGSVQAHLNIARNDMSTIRSSSSETYYDNFFPKRSERMSILGCSSNRLDLFLNNGFTVTLDNSANPSIPHYSCVFRSRPLNECESGTPPPYFQAMLTGRGGGQANKELLTLIRSIYKKIQTLHPNCAPFNQYDVRNIDQLLASASNSDIDSDTLRTANLPDGIVFGSEPKDSYLNIVRHFRRIMMDIACK